MKFLTVNSVYVLLIALSVSLTSYAQSLAPFSSDGCSAFPDGTWENKELFLDCCTLHDFAYWQGGTVEQRIKADQEFSQCISDIGQPELAQFMLVGVRVGGSPYWPTPFRWGYGWPYPKGYGKLTAIELEHIRRLTPLIYKKHLRPSVD